MKGPIDCYLSVNTTVIQLQAQCQLTSTSGYIDKLLKKWCMEHCNPLPTPFLQKANDVAKQLAEPLAIHDEKFVREYQALVDSFLYLQVTIFPEFSWAV